eukprot:685342-Rhodomonas_salina.1
MTLGQLRFYPRAMTLSSIQVCQLRVYLAPYPVRLGFIGNLPGQLRVYLATYQVQRGLNEGTQMEGIKEGRV